MGSTEEEIQAKALLRYFVISAYLAADPPRGQKGAMLRQLASKVWRDENGEAFTAEAETIRAWVRRYKKGGLAALEDKRRTYGGVHALTEEEAELLCALKQEVPERSIERVITIAERMKELEPGKARRSTVHRVLQRRGLSARKLRTADDKDLDRFEAVAPNELWQSDMLAGPWLPDPANPDKVRRAWLSAFMDDHSRLLLHGRFDFKQDQPALELVFRRSLQKWGQPSRCYYDNGAVYRSRHMKQVVAELGIHPIIFTTAYRPMGHGKIEALNRSIRAMFIAELKASNIRTLDELNEAFTAWADLEYNNRVHGETGQTPLERWRAGIERVRYADEERLRLAFLWKETRTPDKSGVFSLFGTRYQVGPELARRRIQVRFDPEDLHEVEVWWKERFVQRVRPFEVQPHRRPKPKKAEAVVSATQDAKKPVADWLGHLVQQRRQEGFIEPPPRQQVEDARRQRAEADQAVLALLRERLDDGVVQDETVLDFLQRFGPFDPEAVTDVLQRLLQHAPADQHVSYYLDAIRQQLRGGQA